MLLMLVLFIGVSIFPVKPVRAATTWYVDGATGSDITGTGTLAAPWKTISHAITDVAVLADDTIMVAAGTYNEEVDITKALSIIGAGAATTIIDGTGVPAQLTGLVAITAPGNVLFTGFTVKNAYSSTMNGASHNRFEIYASGAISGVTYTISYCNLYGTNNPLEDQDYGFYNYGEAANVVFTHNMITQTGANPILVEVCTGATEISYNTLDAGCYGVDPIFFMAYGTTSPATTLIVTTLQNVSYNTFDMGTGGPFDYSHRATGVSFTAPGAAFGVGDGGFTNMVISWNTFSDLQANRRAIGFWNNNGASSEMSGAQVTNNIVYGIGASDTSGVDFYGLTDNTMITGNAILNTAVGIYLRNGDAPGTVIINNNIVGNTVGVDWTLDGGANPVDASSNWWGAPDGPGGVGPGSGDPISNYVDYSPWLLATAPSADFQLTVSSSYDSPNPAVGINYELPGSSVTASVTSPVAGPAGTQYVCTGYTGTGDLAAGGSGSSVSFTITQPTNIIWDWTPQYYLTVDAGGHGTAGGAGWYDANTNAQATITPLSVAGTAGTQYVFAGWSGDATGSGSPSNDILMNSPKTATATWTTQYYVTYAANVLVTLPADEWVASGNAATGVFPPSVISGGNQYVYLGDDRPSTITAPTTITATYKTQYLITFSQTGVGSDFTGTILTVDANAYYYGDLAGPLNLWLDAGTHSFQFFSPLAVGTGERYVWNGTSGGLTTLQGDPLIISSSGSVVGNYKTEYYVTFDQTGVGSDFFGTVVTIDSSTYGVSGLPVSFWWDAGSGHNFSFASPLVINATKQYVWSSTSGLSTLQNDPLTVTASGSVVGNYVLQNAITFDQVGVGSGFTGTMVTIDGTPYGVSSFPVSFYWTLGSAHSFAFQSPLVVTANAEQYVWTATTGLSSVQSDSITVTTYGNIVGNYKTQYCLTVQTSPAGVDSPTGQGWYDAGSSASISTGQYQDIVLSASRYRFNGWTTTNMPEITNPSLNSTTVLMDNAKTVTADYVTQYYVTFAQSGVGSDFSGNVMNVGGTDYDRNGHSDWYDSGASIGFSFYTPLTVAADVKQYLFLSASTSSPLSVSGSVTVTGSYKTQYYVTLAQSGVGSDFLGTVVTVDGTGYGRGGASFWWDDGSVHTIVYASPLVVTANVKQYFLTSVGAASPYTVSASATITGSYKTQYYVMFAQSGVGSDFLGTVVTIDSSNYGVSGLSVSFWWDAGSVHSFSFASPLVVDATKQYFWIFTSGLSTGQSSPLTITASGSVVGSYAPQNAITFAQSGVGSDFSGTVVTVDGTPYGVSSLPVSFYWTMGSAHSFAFQSPLATANADQYVWNGTTGLSSVQNGPMTVTANGTIVGNYKTQYHLTVSYYSGLVPAPTPSSGWFDAGSQVMLTAPQTGHDPQGTFYAFQGLWTVNGLDIKGNTVQIAMNSSTVAIAWYVDPPPFGDVNDDGRVDLADLVLVARHFGTRLGGPGYSILYDLNGDGRIDLLDLAAVARAIQP